MVNGKVVIHQTYVAGTCLECKRTSIRICILHDDCVHGMSLDCGGHF